MKPGPFGQQLTLIEELKAATFLAHARLPSAPLDAQVLGPPFARGFRLAGEAGLTRLNAYGQAVPARWGEYRQLSKASGLTAEERGPVGEAANELFGRFEAVSRAFYPFALGSKTFLVTSTNPEPGRHPIPVDAGGVRASIRATDACRDRLASAVADELAGVEGAVETLRSWRIDPACFPAQRIAAVEASLLQAREQARRPENTGAKPTW